MSELRSNPTPEDFGSRIEAASLIPEAASEFQVDFHRSSLPSAEKGRAFAEAARAAIDAQLLRERERTDRLTVKEELAEISRFGMNLVDCRAWELELNEGEDNHQFRTAAAEFGQHVLQADRMANLESGSMYTPEVESDFSQWAKEFNQNRTDNDMNTGYELTNSRR